MTDAPLPAHLEAFLNAQRVARLATVDAQSRPHVVPVCFAYADGVVYIALDAKPKRVPVRELRRVRNLIANPRCSCWWTSGTKTGRGSPTCSCVASQA